MNIKDLEDPRFLHYLREMTPFPIKPDPEDYARIEAERVARRALPPRTTAEHAHAYRRAEAAKILRLYDAWLRYQRKDEDQA